MATAESAEEAAHQLVQRALDNAGRDNVTVIVIDVHAVGDSRDTSDQASLSASDRDTTSNRDADTAEIPTL